MKKLHRSLLVLASLGFCTLGSAQVRQVGGPVRANRIVVTGSAQSGFAAKLTFTNTGDTESASRPVTLLTCGSSRSMGEWSSWTIRRGFGSCVQHPSPLPVPKLAPGASVELDTPPLASTKECAPVLVAQIYPGGEGDLIDPAVAGHVDVPGAAAPPPQQLLESVSIRVTAVTTTPKKKKGRKPKPVDTGERDVAIDLVALPKSGRSTGILVSTCHAERCFARIVNGVDEGALASQRIPEKAFVRASRTEPPKARLTLHFRFKYDAHPGYGGSPPDRIRVEHVDGAGLDRRSWQIVEHNCVPAGTAVEQRF